MGKEHMLPAFLVIFEVIKQEVLGREKGRKHSKSVDKVKNIGKGDRRLIGSGRKNIILLHDSNTSPFVLLLEVV
jgi:hypothetical protein